MAASKPTVLDRILAEQNTPLGTKTPPTHFSGYDDDDISPRSHDSTYIPSFAPTPMLSLSPSPVPGLPASVGPSGSTEFLEPEHHEDPTALQRVFVAVRVRPFIAEELKRAAALRGKAGTPVPGSKPPPVSRAGTLSRPMPTRPLSCVVEMVNKQTRLYNPEHLNDKPKTCEFDRSYWSFESADDIPCSYAVNFRNPFPKAVSQADVFDDVGKRLVNHMFKWMNSTLLAYGPSGTGKTFTMLGYDGPEREGLIPRICREVFAEKAKNKEMDRKLPRKPGSVIKYNVFVTYVQLYIETVYDLLTNFPMEEEADDKDGSDDESAADPESKASTPHPNHPSPSPQPSPPGPPSWNNTQLTRARSTSAAVPPAGDRSRTPVNPRPGPQGAKANSSSLSSLTKHKVAIQPKNNRIEVYFKPPARRIRVRSPEHAMALVQWGNGARQTFGTQVNEFSSRSHALFTLELEKIETDPDAPEPAVSSAKLKLVDLAGSERVSETGAQGQRLEEAKKINKSLAELGNVVRALARGEKTQFRNDTLTELLHDSLNGESLCSIICCLSPSSDAYEQTRSTLEFADQAKKIPITKAISNENHTAEEMRRWRDETAAKVARFQAIIEQQNSQMKEERGRYEREIEELRRRIEQSGEGDSEGKREMEAQKSKLEQELTELQSRHEMEKQQLDARIRAADEKIVRAQQEQADLVKRMEEIKVAMTSEVQRLRVANEQATKAAESKKDQIERLETDLKKYESNSEQIRLEKERLANEIAQLQKSLESASARATEAERATELKKQAELEEKNRALSQMNDRLSNLEHEKNAALSQIHNTQAALEREQQMLKKQQEELEKANAENMRKASEMNGLRERILELQGKLDMAAQEKKTRVEEEQNYMRAVLEVQRKQYEDVLKQKEDLLAQRTELEAIIERQVILIRELDHKLADANIDAATRKLLEQQKQEAEEARATIHRKFVDANSRLELLQDEIQAKQREISSGSRAMQEQFRSELKQQQADFNKQREDSELKMQKAIEACKLATEMAAQQATRHKDVMDQLQKQMQDQQSKLHQSQQDAALYAKQKEEIAEMLRKKNEELAQLRAKLQVADAELEARRAPEAKREWKKYDAQTKKVKEDLTKIQTLLTDHLNARRASESAGTPAPAPRELTRELGKLELFKAQQQQAYNELTSSLDGTIADVTNELRDVNESLEKARKAAAKAPAHQRAGMLDRVTRLEARAEELQDKLSKVEEERQNADESQDTLIQDLQHIMTDLKAHNVVTEPAEPARKRDAPKGTIRPISSPPIPLFQLEDVASITAHVGEVTCLCSLDPHVLVSGSADKLLKVWNADGMTRLHIFSGHKDAITAVARVNAQSFLSASIDGTIKLWDLNRGCVKTFTAANSAPVNTITLLDPNTFVTGHEDGVLQTWDLTTGQSLMQMSENDQPLTSLARINSNTVACACADGNIWVWEARQGHLLASLDGHRTGVLSLASTESALLSGSADGAVKAWNTDSWVDTQTIEAHTQDVLAILCVPDSLVLSASGDGVVKLWDLRSGDQVAEAGWSEPVTALALLAGDSGPRKIACSLASGTIQILELAEPGRHPADDSDPAGHGPAQGTSADKGSGDNTSTSNTPNQLQSAIPEPRKPFSKTRRPFPQRHNSRIKGRDASTGDSDDESDVMSVNSLTSSRSRGSARRSMSPGAALNTTKGHDSRPSTTTPSPSGSTGRAGRTMRNLNSIHSRAYMSRQLNSMALRKQVLEEEQNELNTIIAMETEWFEMMEEADLRLKSQEEELMAARAQFHHLMTPQAFQVALGPSRPGSAQTSPTRLAVRSRGSIGSANEARDGSTPKKADHLRPRVSASRPTSGNLEEALHASDTETF